ncbi:MAG: 2'-5' RNA ligase family protein [Chitinophagaceae bacterium]|nr:2'-5' RNA ligase family protein [Chitinophagaceae bacterium]
MYMYFIAIVLPENLNEKILKLKNLMLEKYDCKVGLKSPAHITLVPPFWMNEEKEQELISDIDSISSALQPFVVATKNFSAFKPRTIFIDVGVTEQLKSVKIAADKFFSLRPDYRVKVETRPFHPHITIATRDLHKKAFHDAWPLFEHKTFTEEWNAEGISLLRHNKKNWNVIHTSQFKTN